MMSSSSSSSSSSRPEDVGILAMDIYFPTTYVKQTELETFTGASAGKYTIGLGQHGLAFVNDREDIYSICLTVVNSLLTKYDIKPTQIGRLEVATETIQDHSKAVKTVLMQLFVESGNSDIEGIDCMNACYAGTSAFLNSVAWIESRDWDGRYALVVAADIAEYAEGPARPTGGCGAVAFLIGPNAPLVLDSGVRTSHMEHAYDFYKPHMHSPYPVVDGKFSNQCYLRSLDQCYSGYSRKYQSRYGKPYDFLSTSDFFVFHAPYNKLVQKSYARAMFNDFLLNPDRPQYESVQSYRNVDKAASYEDVTLEKAFVSLSASSYAARVAPSILLPTQLGNLYTASLYAGLLSLIVTSHQTLPGKHIMMFSYGSGLASTLFSLHVGASSEAIAALTRIATVTDIPTRLQSRSPIAPSVFTDVMKYRESLHSNDAGFTPKGDITTLSPGTFYLTKKDDQGRRFYQQYVPNTSSQ